MPNLIIQGERLRRSAKICQEHPSRPILLHHTRKRGKGDRTYEPPELSDLAWAGFGEFARHGSCLADAKRISRGRAQIYGLASADRPVIRNLGG